MSVRWRLFSIEMEIVLHISNSQHAGGFKCSSLIYSIRIFMRLHIACACTLCYVLKYSGVAIYMQVLYIRVWYQLYMYIYIICHHGSPSLYSY